MIFGDMMSYGDGCDSCQTAAAAQANSDPNDPNAGSYDCASLAPCATSTGMTATPYTAPGATPAASTSAPSSNSSIWSTLTSAFTTAGQFAPKPAVAAKPVASSLTGPLLIGGVAIVGAVLLMSRKKRRA